MDDLETPKKKRTLGEVVWDKVLRYVEKDDFLPRLWRDTWRLIKASLISYLVWSAPNYNQAIVNLAMLLGTYSGLLPSAMVGFFIVYKWSAIVWFFSKIWELIDRSLQRQKEEYIARKIGPLFEGVPIRKLVEIISSGVTFGRDLVRDETGCSVEQHAMLRELFLACGILVEGDNNSAVMANDYTGEDLEELFMACDDADDMRALFARRNGLKWVVNESKLEREKFSRNRIRK